MNVLSYKGSAEFKCCMVGALNERLVLERGCEILVLVCLVVGTSDVSNV
jgi:hypothetical protein